MDKIKRLTGDQRADLVAYLDGELPEDRTRVIEQALAESDVARHEVESLTRTWQLLDALPREAASADFTAKTLATARVDVAGTGADWRPFANRALVTLGWACWVAAAAVFGFVAGNRLLPRPSDPLLRDLPVLERLDLYRGVGSPDFLRELNDRGLPPTGGEGAP